jgi:hypothetical protein
VKTRRTAALSIAAALCMTLVPIVTASQARTSHGEPVVRLLATKRKVTVVRYGRRAPRLQPGMYVAVTQGTLDLRVRRESFTDPVQLTQVVHSATGRTERALDADLVAGWKGLDNFFRVRATDADGRVVWTDLVTFCPNSYMRQRLSDAGPDKPTFPYGCYSSPRLLGMAWGIDEDWATSASSFRGVKLPLPDGTYTVDVAIAARYRELFGIALEDATAQLAVTVRTKERSRCRHCGAHRQSMSAQGRGRPERGVPDMPNPDDSVLPDLRALPAFSMDVRNTRRGRSFLEFAATVWVAGAAPIVVEGFRRGDEAVMDAYQYFYDDGEAGGRAAAGTFEYDERDGHLHWHILQFVRYQLLDVEQTFAVRSAKESFCLVPTDAVDLALDHAARAEEGADLHTSCGGEDALWIRETLPVGWGDTYYQGGRYGFDITDVPNGTYFVEVAANPDGLLLEQDETNNAALREVTLRGKAGARRVIVPDPYGIDGGW